jgi:hypothetical protein
MILATATLAVAAGGLAWAQTMRSLDMASDFIGSRIVTELSGDQEVGSVATRSFGHAYFDVRSDGTLHYRIDTTGLTGITGVYIQMGEAGQVGPVVARLFVPPQPTGLVRGSVTEGTFTADQLAGPLAGQSVNDLVRLMMDNKAYVNIATAIYADGQIRGNIPYPYH